MAVPSTVELLTSARLHVRVRARRHGRLRVGLFLQVAGKPAATLGPARSITLGRERWKSVSLPVSPAGRAKLATCPAWRVAVIVTDSRLGRRRTASRPLRLDPPDCARFFGPTAVWNAPLPADAPLDPDSRAVTANLLAMVDASSRSNMPPTINTSAYAPAVYTVGADQPRVAVHVDKPPGSSDDLVAAFSAVPLPPTARPSPGTDAQLVVWQPATDTMWEFWRLRRDSGGVHASYGGRLEDVSHGPGYFSGPHALWGATATSLPLAGGTITPRELALGEIDHALSVGIPRARAGVYSLPAQRTDGVSHCEHAVPEGARFRLDPQVDVGALGLPPVVAAMARAAQRYGIFVRDQAGTVAFTAQSVVSLPTDPYPALFGGRPPYELLKSFPWSHLQLVRMDLRSEPHHDPSFGPAPGLFQGCS